MDSAIKARLQSNGRGGDVDMVDLTCELAQVAYIARE
jgi:hypothetical protein